MSSQSTKQPWWRADRYEDESPAPEIFTDLAGPLGPALVRTWPDGRTDKGWGLQGANGDQTQTFMPKYLANEFNARRVLYGYARGKWAFAFVMRSLRALAVDIDGKNGGFDHVKRLGLLPPTLAETSKSGNGYHLFYRTPEDWDVDTGYGLLPDQIGVEQGVDIRAVGCVFHHDTQRWNDRPIADLPEHLFDTLLAKRQRIIHSNDRITKVVQGGDTMETLMLHDELMTDLRKPMAPGKRNNTLFAIGQKMKQAGVPEWEEKVSDRASEVGLDLDEIEQLVRNITRYN